MSHFNEAGEFPTPGKPGSQENPINAKDETMFSAVTDMKVYRIEICDFEESEQRFVGIFVTTDKEDAIRLAKEQYEESEFTAFCSDCRWVPVARKPHSERELHEIWLPDTAVEFVFNSAYWEEDDIDGAMYDSSSIFLHVEEVDVNKLVEVEF